MKDLRVKITDCSNKELVRIARRCGFVVLNGRKHDKVKTSDEKFVTTIPRHNRLKRETVVGIINDLNSRGATIIYS